MCPTYFHLVGYHSIFEYMRLLSWNNIRTRISRLCGFGQLLVIHMKNISIKTPNDLIRALKFIRTGLDEGRIKLTFEYKNQNKWDIPQSKFITKFNWPDYFSNYYEEISTGKIFRLYAETYHGGGGKLEEVQNFED